MTVASVETVEDRSSLGFSIPLAAVRAEGDSLATRLSGSKRPAPREDEDADDDVSALSEFSMDNSDVFDLSLVSPLCHQLLETKRRMLAQPSADDKDGQSPRTDSSSRSDDEASEQTASPSKQATDKPRTTSSRPSQRHNPALEGLSPEAILQRKAQRRREQVRAASRRCRDRQRKETEDLRKKVFQLEEFIAHTIKSYEWELRQQRGRVDALERENALLAQRLGGSSPVASMPEQHDVFDPELEFEPESLHSPSFEPVKVEDNDPSMSPLAKFPASVHSHHHQLDSSTPSDSSMTDFWNEEGYPEMLLETVADTKRVLISMLGSTCPIYTSTQIFGWDFDFWIDGPRYFAKDRKFFPGFRAYELAQRQHHVDVNRYLETFTEIKEKETLKVINEHVKIMRTVKSLPGKPVNQSLTVQFASPVDGCNGSRWVVAERSIGELKSLKYGVEKECNGYVFEDVIKVLEDGSKVEGCLVQGVGGFECDGKQPEALIEELMKAFSTVVLRWEGLFVNDYIQEDAGFADIELDFDLRPMC